MTNISMSGIVRKIVPESVKAYKRSVQKKINRKKRLLRLSWPATKLLGPLYKVNHKKIEIDITFDCNLRCLNCDRSCRRAPAPEYMSIEQIKKFIGESERKKRKWETVIIIGGEPTLHPHIFEIVKLLISYKKRCGNKVRLVLATNGYGPIVKGILSKIPQEISILNTNKKVSFQETFWSYNAAPVDIDRYRNVDYSNKCFVTSFCGIGLSKFGYYLCSAAANVDRIFGFDIGGKELPSTDDPMLNQARTLCKYCGHFKQLQIQKPVRGEEISMSWRQAYEKYDRKKPVLTEY